MKNGLITIDFWNTIFDSSGNLERNKLRLKKLIEVTDGLGYMIKQDELDKSLKKSWEYFNNVWINESRTPNSVDMIKFLWKELNLEHNDSAIEELSTYFSKSILLKRPNIIEGAKEVISELNKDYYLAIISDTGFSGGSVLRVLLEDAGIFDYFTAFSFSDETQVAKPNKLAFQKIFHEINISPDKSIHIGDIERTDIVGAKSYGMKAIKFVGDETSLMEKRSDDDASLADAIVNHWSEIPNQIATINNN